MTGTPVRNRLSIIVPVLDEARTIAGVVTRLARDVPHGELLVVDGGSSDATVEIATAAAESLAFPGAPPAAPVRVLRADRGRARQMNAGAAAAIGDVLWFVHADTLIAPGASGELLAALDDPAVVGGGLCLRFDHDRPALRWLAWTSNGRARRLGQVFGDQAMFVRREIFTELGGFPDLPLMEDFSFTRRLHRRGRVVLLTATVTASSRRFDQHGTLRMLVFMQWLKLLFLCGADPAGIARRYARGPLPRRRSPARPPIAQAPGAPGAHLPESPLQPRPAEFRTEPRPPQSRTDAEEHTDVAQHA